MHTRTSRACGLLDGSLLRNGAEGALPSLEFPLLIRSDAIVLIMYQ